MKKNISIEGDSLYQQARYGIEKIKVRDIFSTNISK